MCSSSIGSLDEALIQLQYALGDYYSCGKRATEFGPLDARLRVLREACVAAQTEISLFGAGGGPIGFAPLAPLVDQPIPRHVAHR
jgi:hypothetical protein